MSKHQPGTDDETFRRAIGWQAPSSPLPDDYEEQLLDRLFADGGPQLSDLSLHELGIDELGPVSAGAISLRPGANDRSPAEVRRAREAVSPPPLVDTPPVSPKLPWHPSRRMGMALAAAAAVALLGLSQRPEPSAAEAVLPVALPTFSVPDGVPSPESVRPLAPEQAQPEAPARELLSDDENDTFEAPEDPTKGPGARLAIYEGPTHTADAMPPEEATLGPDDTALELEHDVPMVHGVQLARLENSRFDGGRLFDDGRMEDPRFMTAIEDTNVPGTALSRADLSNGGLPGAGFARANFKAAAGDGLGFAHMGPSFDPNAGHAEVAAAILDDEMPLPAGAVDEPVATGILPTDDQPIDRPGANAAPHSLGQTQFAPRWLGLGVSMAADVQTSVPAGIRVVGAIDISKTHRQLRF